MPFIFRELQFSMTVYNQEEAAFTPLHSHHQAHYTTKFPRCTPQSLIVMYVTEVTRKKKRRIKGKGEMPDVFADVSISSICTFYLLYYTHDLHILPSNEITMMETSSW